MISVDLLIIGAGLAGIGSAVHFKKQYPNKTFAIIEKRSNLGGTWDVFKYPGVRSDSDMFTLGYSFKPWTGNFFATGAEINNYIKETAEEYDIVKHIHFNNTASGLEWENNRWTLYTNRQEFTAKFVMFATGYINHEQSHHPYIRHYDKFKGKIVHTQYWDDKIDYTDKNIAVIGSGATAYTLIPELAKTAKQVTMIQRSPTYVRSEKSNPEWLQKIRDNETDNMVIHTKAREQSILLQQNQYHMCKDRPVPMKRILINDVKNNLHSDVNIKHFTPNYMPWDQRICAIVDNNFLNKVNEGSVSIETDTVNSITEKGIVLDSGKSIDADIIVMATGFETRMFGDVVVRVNDTYVDITKLKAYKGSMIEGIPNFGYIFGYASMSWTLKLELALQYFSRVFEYMNENKHDVCVPVDDANTEGGTGFIGLSSNFYLRNEHRFPRQGTSLPWMNTNNIQTDKKMFTEDKIDDGVLRFI